MHKVNGNCFVAYIKLSREDIYQHHYSPVMRDDLNEMINMLIENITNGYAYAEMIVNANGKIIFSLCADDFK